MLADLPREVSAALARLEGAPIESRSPAEQLEAVFSVCTPYRFEAGPLVVLTDPRWFSTRPDAGPRGALLELRRWPGDTVLAIYALAGPLASQGDAGPPIDEGRFAREGVVAPGWERWGGSVTTGAGERRAVWLEREVEEAPAHLGVLILPGDAGLGAEGIDDLELEALGLLPRIELRGAAWRARSGVPAGERVVLPTTAIVPGQKTESEAPWQVVRGRDFTVGLPPGFRARRMDGSVPPPREIEGGQLWLRGRFVDEEATEVVVGDGGSFGYIAEVKPLTDDWIAGERAPLGSPAAERIKSQPFDSAAEQIRAKSVRAERWKDAELGGEWLVFRLRFDDRGLEIALPVLRGRESPSLYWIPWTWRSSDRPPAPPPVDPAKRFGIRFDRVAPIDQPRHPWTEGYLRVPGLRVEVPKDWYPAAALRSDSGYPVRLLHRSASAVRNLVRLAADELPDFADEATGWSEAPIRGRHRAASIYRRSDGAALVVAREGHAFLFEPASTAVEGWREFWDRMLASLQLMPAER